MKQRLCFVRELESRQSPKGRVAAFGLLLFSLMAAGVANAQDVRYSWFEIGFIGQDISRSATAFDLDLNQSVDIDATDGSGVRFRGSAGRWNGLYAFFEFSTADPDVSALVTNPQGEFSAADEFDFTQVRGGAGFAWELSFRTHILTEITYDSVSYDFGSFAGEDFDFEDQDFGAALGIRSMVSDSLELRASARYSNLGDVDLTAKEFDSDVLFAVGAGFTLVRGLSITFDYETGEVETYSIGFRLDLDED